MWIGGIVKVGPDQYDVELIFLLWKAHYISTRAVRYFLKLQPMRDEDEVSTVQS
jgi:hypothetical protein